MGIQMIYDVGIIIFAPCVQSVFGWAKRALADDEVTLFEWRALAITIVRVGSVSAAAYYGLTFAGMDVSVLSVALGGFLFDKIHQAIKF